MLTLNRQKHQGYATCERCLVKIPAPTSAENEVSLPEGWQLVRFENAMADLCPACLFMLTECAGCQPDRGRTILAEIAKHRSLTDEEQTWLKSLDTVNQG